MPPDILVRHCELTIRGHGGWGWGTDPRRCLEPALAALERAFERILDELGAAADTDLRIADPIRLTWRRDGTLSDDSLDQIKILAGTAMKASASTKPAVSSPTSASALVEPPASAPPPLSRAAAVARLLAGWSRAGLLARLVTGWPAAAVHQWVEVARRGGTDPAAVELAEPAVAAIADLVLDAPPSPTSTPPAGSVPPGSSSPGSGPLGSGPRGSSLPADVRLLVLLGALAAAASDQPLGTRTIALAAARAGDPGGVPGPIAATTGNRIARPPATLDGMAGEVSGLPFLALIQLGRIGYLDAVWAAADPLLARLLVAGLAGKTLPPPARGWRREPAEIAAIAVAAGLGSGEADDLALDRIADLAGVVRPLESALVALYGGNCAEVTITATGDGVICGETAGALPIAWVDSDADVDVVLDQLGRPSIRTGTLFSEVAAELANRRAYPNRDLVGLERHLGAAAGAALGSLAQELWGVDAPDAPRQALDRLTDFDVRVRPSPGGLEVAVPRGRRWLDLRRAGLLDRWEMPWAPGGWELVTW